MAKGPRTLEQLFDSIDEEMNWRKIELSALRTSIKDGDKSPKQRALLRASIALLYAHWEGAVKNITQLYLEYLKVQKIRLKDLSPTMFGVALKSKIEYLHESDSAKARLNLSRTILEDLQSRANFRADLVQTGSNLNSRIFREIVSLVDFPDKMPGLPGRGRHEVRSYEEYFETKWAVVDEQLLARRNMIAHGEYLELTHQEYFDTHDIVFDMLRKFSEGVRESARRKLYLKADLQLPSDNRRD